MMIRACRLACKDYMHETLLSACAILSLAAVFAPLLVLYGVKFGAIHTMTERHKNDPRNLEIIPVASGSYSTADIIALQKHPIWGKHTDFILPRTRSIAATMSLFPHGEDNILQRVTLSLEPTGFGDTLLEHYGINTNVPYIITENTTNAQQISQAAFAITLSAEAARKLKAVSGTALQGRVERLSKGKVERATVNLVVHAVLPLEAQQKDVAFIPLVLLEATEDFRDARPLTNTEYTTQELQAALPASQGWDVITSTMPPTKRVYAGFRAYAKDLESVDTLRHYFIRQNIDVFTQAEQIATVRSLDASLTLIFTLIGTAAALGFFASTASNVLASVRRKERYLGILRLMGYTSRDIMIFPLFQTFLTAILGSFLAAGLYYITATLIDSLFAQSLHGIEKISSLPATHFVLAMGIVCLLALSAALFPAMRAARIEPSEVIRDV